MAFKIVGTLNSLDNMRIPVLGRKMCLRRMKLAEGVSCVQVYIDGSTTCFPP